MVFYNLNTESYYLKIINHNIYTPDNIQSLVPFYPLFTYLENQLLYSWCEFPSTLVPSLLTTAPPFTSYPTLSHPTDQVTIFLVWHTPLDDVVFSIPYTPHTRVFLPLNSVTASPESAFSGDVADSSLSRPLSHQGYFFLRFSRPCSSVSSPSGSHAAWLSSSYNNIYPPPWGGGVNGAMVVQWWCDVIAVHWRAGTLDNITYGVYKHLSPVQHNRYHLRAVLV
jgi:hypothetical protein